jgi:hypothetical protein
MNIRLLVSDMLLAGFAFVVFHDVPSVIWNSKYLVALRFNTSVDYVVADPIPNDCHFLAAPLGEKGCNYSPSVLIQGDTIIVRWTRVNLGKVN